MKKIWDSAKPIYKIIILDIVGLVLMNWIMSSQILTNSKISLSVIVGVVVLGLIILIYQRSFIKAEEERDQRLEDRFEAYYIKLKELADKKDNEINANYKALEEKYHILEAEQYHFPLHLSKRFVIQSINRVGHQPFVDSDWLISGEHNGQLFSGNVTRPDTETKSELIKLVQQCATPDAIMDSLDMYDELYPENETEVA